MIFLKFMPNLKRLHVTDEWGKYDKKTKSVSNTSPEEMDNVRLVKLTDFRMEFSVRNGDLSKLVKWMPNVETLGMILDDKQFAMVCQSWRNLSILDDLGRSLTDNGVIARVKVEGSNGTQANTALLHDLKTFRSSSNHITEAGLLYVLAELPCLEDLIIHEDINISDEGYSAIYARNVRIKTHNPESPPSPMERDYWL